MKGKSANRFFSAGVRSVAVLLAVEFTPPSTAALAAGHSTTNPPPKLNLQEAPLSREVKAATSLAPVLKKVAPSVVNIYSTVTVRERANPLLDDPVFRQFFGGRLQPREHKEQGLGSGTIVTSDGYILTANHVVQGADKVKVALASGQKEYDAKIVGTDPLTDVAVLKIDSTELPAATISDSDTLEVGDMVLAIGNPFGVGQTVTMGIVSATGRGGFGMGGYENFIQTDAAINPGNSGGALVDAEGRLVGINTWIISRSGGNQGIGFAVPINMARYVMERLTHDGKVTRGFLGLSLLEDMTPEVAKQFGLPDTKGALVTGVEPDSPAAKAGFKEEDFVIEFNGKKVTDMRQLRLMVSETAPGTKITAKILRDSKERTLTATLTAFPERLLTGTRRPQPGAGSQEGDDSLSGIEVADLDTRTRRELDIPNNVHGALVSRVEQDSDAAGAGLQLHDVITGINRQAVRNADDAVALSEKAKGEQVLLRIWRASEGGGGTLYLTVHQTKHH